MSAQVNHQLSVITGATSGLGRATALALARHGFDLVLLGRNTAAGETVVRRIRRIAPQARAEFVRLDLTIPFELYQFADWLRDRHPQVDVLINNAGTQLEAFNETANRIERTFATNHLGHFLLTALLLDRLLAAPAGRVITVGSGAPSGVTIESADYWCLDRSTYDRRLAYARSKLANLLFACELARRLQATTVTSNAVDPGSIVTCLGRNQGWRAWLRRLGSQLLQRDLATPRRGAETIVHLATSPDLRNVSGRYFRKREPINCSDLSQDEDSARTLWDLSLRLTRLDERLGPAWDCFKPAPPPDRKVNGPETRGI